MHFVCILTGTSRVFSISANERIFKMTSPHHSTTSSRCSSVPRIGVVGLAYPGFNLGEGMCESKLREMVERLGPEPLDVVVYDKPVFEQSQARDAGEFLSLQGIDCILAVIATFVPDYYVVELLHACDTPIFLWAVERELQCVSLVCGPMISATLFELGKHYRLAGADISDERTLGMFRVFARGCMLRRLLRQTRVGYVGGKPPIMFSMSADDYSLNRTLGVSIVNLGVEEFYRRSQAVSESEAQSYWQDLTRVVGRITVSETDGLLSSRYYLAARKLCDDFDLRALSLNCFPHLKSQICLAVARLNDEGIAAACEGDLHSTILMHALHALTNIPSFNGDFMRLFEPENDVLFSHCGSGAFSLARCPKDVCLQASIETNDGCAVCYATHARGEVTLTNLMGARESLRLAAMHGTSVETDTSYEGTPMRVHFNTPVRDIVAVIASQGAGHHWNGGFGDLREELKLLCELTGIKCNILA
jgi:L-fucose isomerase-like protein